METNDSNIKPQQIGGLKLMTVFVLVIVAHVVVLGGITAYCLMKGGSSDADLLTDLTHKNAKSTTDVAASESLPTDAPQAEKTEATIASTDTGNPALAPAPTTTSAASQTPPAEPAASMETGVPAPVMGPVAINPPSGPPIVAPRGPVITPPAVPPAKTNVASVPAPAPETQAAAPAVGEGMPYVVKAGDSIAKIARKNHTTIAKLKEANGLNSDLIHIGQKMVIPAKTQVASAAPAAETSGSTTILSDSVAAPAPVHVAKTSVTAAPANLTAPAPGSTVARQGHTYTVIKGDTLTKIAHKFKTTPTAIMTANNLTDAGKLSIGEKLKIPAQGVSSQESRSATTISAPITTPSSNTTPVPAAQPSQVQVKADTTAQLANFIQ